MSGQENTTSGVQNILGYKRSKKRGKRAKRAKVLDGETYLYRHLGRDGRLLYVGISLSAGMRQRSHQKNAHWYRDVSTIKVERFPTRLDAEIAEYLAIRDETPQHNSPGWRRYFTDLQIQSFRDRMEIERFCGLKLAEAGVTSIRTVGE